MGLVGCGRLAERAYVHAVQRAEGVRLTAVADPVAARCERVAPGVRHFASAADLLAARAADILVLATPADAHVEDARRASEVGMPTLVEKPPARNGDEAAMLAALDPPPWIGFNRRFEDRIARLREATRDTSALDLSLRLTVRAGSWDAYDVRDPVLLDLGPHLVDLALWLSRRRPERVAARVEDNAASIRLELNGGGSALLGVAAGRRHREQFDVRTDRGRARYRAGGFVRSLRAKNPLIPSLTRQLESFARAARGYEEPVLATAAQGFAVMRILDAVRASSELGETLIGVDVSADARNLRA